MVLDIVRWQPSVEVVPCGPSPPLPLPSRPVRQWSPEQETRRVGFTLSGGPKQPEGNSGPSAREEARWQATASWPRRLENNYKWEMQKLHALAFLAWLPLLENIQRTCCDFPQENETNRPPLLATLAGCQLEFKGKLHWRFKPLFSKTEIFCLIFFGGSVPFFFPTEL